MNKDAGEQKKSKESSRREFVRRAMYVAPVLLTLPAAPAEAQVGSQCLDPDARCDS